MSSSVTILSRRRIIPPKQKRIQRRGKSSRDAAILIVERLEDRRMLSVTASTLAGPRNAVGTTWSYELLQTGNSTPVETNTQTVIGTTTFNGQSAVEIDENGSESGAAATTMDKSYDSITSAGLVAYGNTSVVNEAGSISDISTTYSPPEVILPPTMVAGTTYTETTTSTAVTTGASSSTNVIQQTTMLTLESARQMVTVPAQATPYTAYVIDETLTTTSVITPSGGSPITTGPITSMLKGYYVANVGLVEFGNAASGETELTAFSTPGGGGGGGGGSTGITPAITSLTLPAAVVGGAKIHGRLKLALTNSGSTDEKGFTVKVFASTDTTLDTSVDPLVSSVIKTSTIKPGKSTTLNDPITGLPASLPDGTYYLFVQTTDSAGNTLSTVAGSTVTVAAPFVALSESVSTTLPSALVSGTKAKGTVTLLITNNGNVPSKGSTAINITASPTSGTVGTSIVSFSKNLNIANGKTVKVNEAIKSIPALADNNYFLVVQTTDPFAAGISVASSAGTIDIAAPFVALAATLGPVTNVTSGDILTITNNGNVDDDTTLTGTLGFSLNADGTGAIGSTAPISTGTLHIKTGKSVKVHLTGWKSILSGLVTGEPYYLTASITDATGNSAAAVSSTSFTR